jgi:hypothetical protein
VVALSREVARIGLRSAIVVLSVVLTVLVLAVAFLPRPSAAADDHPLLVNGYIYDNAGHKIANADVVVTMYNGATPGVSKTDTSSSSPLGYFSVNFGVGDWATGNTIWVVAQYQGGTQAVNHTVTANGIYMFQWENATIPYEIPQFGNTTGLLLTVGLVGVVAAVAVVWRRSAK